MSGLRERKRQRTREAIRRAAMELFVARGFDNVSVVEIADAAEVAEKTIFNYFPNKEALFFDEQPVTPDAVVHAIRTRPPGESAVGAVRAYVLKVVAVTLGTHPAEPDSTGPTPQRPDSADLAGQPPVVRGHAGALQAILHSPALQLHLREVFARCEAATAAVLAEETDAREDAVEPGVAAVLICGTLRALYERVVRAAGSDADPIRALAAFSAEVERAFAILESGLAGYAVAAPAE